MTVSGDPDAGPHALYFGHVTHARMRPFRHQFRYGVYTALFDLDRLDALPGLIRRNGFGLFGLHDHDHGPRDGGPLRPWVEGLVRDAGLPVPGGRIRLLCFPRVLGFIFNPLSVYFCHRPDDTLAAIVYEVKNTFGDQHPYVVPVGSGDGREDGPMLAHRHPKEFHVSPFFDLEGEYRFRISEPDEHLHVLIRYGAQDGERMIAAQTGRRAPMTNATLLRAFFAYPLVTMKVVGAIHWEALRLWLKGAKFHRRPDPPVHPKDRSPRIRDNPAA